MVEKAARLVEGEDEKRSRPGGARGDGVVHPRHEPFAGPDVDVRMVAVPGPEKRHRVERIDVGDRRKIACATVAEEGGELPGDREIPRAPEAQIRERAPVVPRRHSLVVEQIPDRGQAFIGGLQADLLLQFLEGRFVEIDASHVVAHQEFFRQRSRVGKSWRAYTPAGSARSTASTVLTRS